jgi:hypothetical protein
VQTSAKKIVERRVAGNNIWLSFFDADRRVLPDSPEFDYKVFETEAAVGQAMFDELDAYANEKPGDITVVLLGGRGAQAMYTIISRLAETDEIDSLLGRLHVFTQDALAPMRMNNGLSFVRDFERLLGPKFFAKIKSFTAMLTETDDLESALSGYMEKLESLGGIFAISNPDAALGLVILSGSQRSRSRYWSTTFQSSKLAAALSPRRTKSNVEMRLVF